MALDYLRALGGERLKLIDHLWIELKQDMPAVILTYVTMDTFASQNRKGEISTPQDFRDWMREFFLPGSELESASNVTPDELWASRCGVLHAYSPFARDTLTKGVARLVFSTGFEAHLPVEPSTGADFQAGRVKLVPTHHLFDALGAALSRFFEVVGSDPARAQLVQSHERELFVPWVPERSSHSVSSQPGAEGETGEGDSAIH